MGVPGHFSNMTMLACYSNKNQAVGGNLKAGRAVDRRGQQDKVRKENLGAKPGGWRGGLEGGSQRLGVQELEHERQSERGQIIRLKAHDRRHLHGIKIRKSYRWLPSSSVPF